MNEVLNIQDRFEERKFIITSTIRLLSLCDFSNEAIAMMAVTSRSLREIEENEGSISDEGLFLLYDEKMKEEQLKEMRG